MTQQLEVVTIITQDGERQLMTMKQDALVTEKNGSLFIRYKEEKTDIPVLIKWDKKHVVQLTRRSQPVNKMLFVLDEEVEYLYQTQAGVMPLATHTEQITPRFNAKEELEHFEWAYKIKNGEEILGDYQVKLHFL
ncbi:Uncharacterized beta-barrel protein YwiB, DUF1934 family [Granulicatella balaenopterae]|uniref:Uncharacterized beta-barrel protein YwiB, DUF1934 family n=1 Tax=Granulicatella balaenopterae TaxID=137733 RepID=A0A1H9MGU2_9LACT|nr:DUF1934 domain-containing protein [Granulicatella balaenopterae]SER22940.1 Uncharacterized beta-barrel protein YwiB, DUF1934 family [Granulicatella balaenopterae]